MRVHMRALILKRVPQALLTISKELAQTKKNKAKKREKTKVTDFSHMPSLLITPLRTCVMKSSWYHFVASS